jgi:hypothetical protein
MSIQINLEGWKGEDTIEIIKNDEEWIIVEHRKEKNTKNIYTNKTIIPHKYIRVLWTLIKRNFEIGEKIKYRDLVPKVINFYNYDVNIDGFNGGKNRAKIYFPKYYYPLKVLEYLNYVYYGGRGTIKRIK